MAEELKRRVMRDGPHQYGHSASPGQDAGMGVRPIRPFSCPDATTTFQPRDTEGSEASGKLEHTYEVCLEAALRQRGLQVERQVPVRVRYLDVDLDCGYRIDMLVQRAGRPALQFQRGCPRGRRLEASPP
jgi:hypothetical protein